MKKILLFVALATLSIMGYSQSVWNVGNDPTNFPVSSGVSTGNDVTINGLTIVAGGTNITNMAVVEANSKTFTSPTTSDSYTFINRFKFNGAGYASASDANATPLVNMPTQRYLTINVAGNSSIYAIGLSGNNSSERKLFVTDGTNYIGLINFPYETSGSTNVAVMSEGTVNYTGPATTLYLFCNAAVNLYYLSATNVVTTGVPEVNANKAVKSVELYDFLGKKLPQNAKGLVIRKTTYEDGSTYSEKLYIQEK